MIGIGRLLSVGCGDLAVGCCGELCQPIELLVRVKDQVLRAFDSLGSRLVLLTRFLGLESERLDDLESLLPGILFREPIWGRSESVHEQFDDAQGSRTGLVCREELLKGGPHGLLPCLGADPRPADPAIQG